MNAFNVLFRVRYLIIAFLFLIMGLILKTIKDPDNIQLREFNKFQTKLNENETRMGQILMRLSSMPESNINELMKQDDVLNKDYFEEFGFSFYIYSNDTLAYWSNNSAPEINKNKNEGLVHLLNGYYLLKRKEINENNYIIGLLLIKYDYSYENDFIKNTFHPAYNINPFFEILTGGDSGFPIYNNDRNYLFSLSTNADSLSAKYINYAISLCYFITIIAFLMFCFRLINRISMGYGKIIGIIAFGGILTALRFLMLEYKAPYIFYSLELFQPHLFATSYLIPSLGDLFLHTLFIFFFVFSFYKNIDFVQFKQKWKNYTILLVIAFLAVILFGFTHHFFRSLILHSSISFEVHRFLDLSAYSMVGFTIIAFQLLSFLLFIDKIVVVCKTIFKFRFFLVLAITIVGVFSFMIKWIFYEIELYSIVFTVLIFLYVGYIRYKIEKFNYSALILLLIVLAIYSEAFILNHTNAKEKEKRRVLVVNLANERDQIAEMLLDGVEQKIQNDTIIKDLMKNYLDNELAIEEYLEMNYFGGYFRKFNIQGSVCSPFDNLTLIGENITDVVHCYDYFDEYLNKDGLKLPGSRFYFIDNLNGQISYIGKFTYKIEENEEASLFVSVDSKLVTKGLGYPELLLDNKMTKSKVLSDYSYAKYRYGKIVTRSGEYKYKLQIPESWVSGNEFLFISAQEFEHLIYNVDETNQIVISKAKLSYIDILATFSYLFVFYYVLLSLGMFFIRFPQNIKSINYDFKNRIKISIVGVLILSLIIVGIGTVIYNIKQFERKHHESINEKIQSVLTEVKHKLGGEHDLDVDIKDYLQYLLNKFSDVFFTDINIYDVNGDLLATSRPMIFEKGLMGNKMNVQAFQEMSIKHSQRFIHKEHIGNLEYYSAYMPFINDNNELLAYLNLPYFTRQSELKRETYTLVIALVNIYFFLILLSTIVAVLISNNITKPLKMIQERFRKIDLNKPHEPIKYQSQDEIGNLIQEYNRMGSELASNAVKLARSERESAWREMAKQIAHEIKNPLTPMKLSVQYLERARHDKVDDFDERLSRFSSSMIEQINKLSSIATEFSNFAKMPKGTNEKLDIIIKIKNTVDLFDKTENTKFFVDYHDFNELFVYADKNQISIVFTNLIQNALQAIPKHTDGEINIDVRSNDGKVIISVSDNGSGIPEDVRGKLFQPNFTTKTSGMGMGLAIVKNILDNCNGEIWYDTKINEGTIFYVSLPKMN